MTATTHTFQVEGMHCGSCPLLIDDVLEDLPGVHSTHSSLKQQRTTVELDTTVTSPHEVISAIAELGYRATPTAAPAGLADSPGECSGRAETGRRG